MSFREHVDKVFNLKFSDANSNFRAVQLITAWETALERISLVPFSVSRLVQYHVSSQLIKFNT